MSHCLRQVSTLSRTPLQRSYDTLALTSLRVSVTIGTIDVVIVTDLLSEHNRHRPRTDGCTQDSIKKVRHVSYWNLTVIYICMCFLHLFSVRSMQRNTPGLLDRRIGPKDMFIVLLYMYVCICCQLFIQIINCCCIVY